MSEYHVSVLLNESIENLINRSDGNYVDVTFGAGGHSRLILNRLSAKGHLYSFDQDADAVINAIDDSRFKLIESNFRYVRKFLKLEGICDVDGILADLGVSSHQLDRPERGFSYRFDAPLDMRMNKESDLSAANILQTYDEDRLVQVFSDFGEVRNAKTLSKAVLQARKLSPIKSTFDFNRILEKQVIGPRMKYFSQVYQSLRIEVNDEIGALKEMLTEGYRILKPGGRFVVITFHSIEDRVVKNYFKTGNFEGVVKKDNFGNISRLFTLINKNVILAGQNEQKNNIRSRSAKLRVAEKI
ncbi:MAG: 16S rRNA (cytosine(1402)-N(4))-methyltransferase RsmH [Saprospiraceae bacterium]|nr:16S rRNA (cytosine(1402)-N(4))-methyltransferase RsmH [Saprospiraceae bacterium]